MAKNRSGEQLKLWHHLAVICLGGKCVNCNSSENLHIHHKNGNPQKNELENLELLCKKCHGGHHSLISLNKINKINGINRPCPKCGSDKTIKFGKTIRSGQEVQQRRCKAKGCGHIFVEKKVVSP